jgi:hypothetical protein
MTYQTVFLRAACTCVCAREGGWNLDNTTEEDACHVSCDEEDACHVSCMRSCVRSHIKKRGVVLYTPI